MAPVMTLRGVEKIYGRSRVLRIGLMELRTRRTTLVYGANGAGKSTLLRVLAGIGSIKAGHIERHRVLQHARLGFLPQHGGIYTDATVRENLALRRRLYGLPEEYPEEPWHLKAFGLDRFAHREVQQLSAGYQRLVAIAATFHIKPDWVLLDEPFTSLDATHCRVLKSCLASVAEQLILFVISATDDVEIMAAHDVVRLKEGEIE
jgi:ABC-type multidrug transport system ATPase subunit